MTALQQTVLQQKYRRLNYDVRVTTKTGRQISLRHYRGREFLRRLRISADIDSPSMELELDVQREWESISFSPLMLGSIANRVPVGGASDVALQQDNVVQVFVGVPGLDALTEEFMCIFYGRISSVDSGSPIMKVVARDPLHDLNAAWITDAEQELGSAGGTPAEVIMVDLMNRYGLGIPSIYTPTSPGWMITPYLQERSSLWEALSRFAAQIGWDLRWRWRPGDAYDGAPTFFEPGRDNMVDNYLFRADDYYDLSSLPVNLDEVRNSIYVTYGPEANRQTVWHLNLSSIEKYRLTRSMWIEEASNSPLQSEPEANAMALAALRDLSRPKASMSATMPLFPWVELHDRYAFAPNMVHFDSLLSFSTSGYAHEISGGEATTTLNLRDGGPAAGAKSWLRREFRQGVKYL